jgi:hypothetical protein
LTLVDDIRSITNVLVVDDGDAKAAHWNNSARTLLTGTILFTLTRAPDERNLITVCELLSLTYAPLVKDAKQAAAKQAVAKARDGGKLDKKILRRQQRRRRHAPPRNGEIGQEVRRHSGRHQQPLSANAAGRARQHLQHRGRANGFSRQLLAAADVAALRFSASRLARGPANDDFPVPAGGPHGEPFRWLRLMVQLACTVLEQMGPYPRAHTACPST